MHVHFNWNGLTGASVTFSREVMRNFHRLIVSGSCARRERCDTHDSGKSRELSIYNFISFIRKTIKRARGRGVLPIAKEKDKSDNENTLAAKATGRVR